MLETIGFIAFILAIAFVAFMSPKRTDEPPKRPADGSPPQADENKKDSDSASNSAPK